jgi:hypothetical protein
VELRRKSENKNVNSKNINQNSKDVSGIISYAAFLPEAKNSVQDSGIASGGIAIKKWCEPQTDSIIREAYPAIKRYKSIRA